jgi:thymidylate synthase
MLGIFNCLNKERKTNECKTSNNEEQQYLDLIKDIINNGSIEESRNGKTYTKFGNIMKFSLKNGKIPILTTKQLAWRVCFEELFWFIKGSTNNTELKEKKVNIWNDNSSREFLDSRGLYNLEENDLGPVYGHQWRHFNAEYFDCNTNYKGEGIDQLQYIIDQLKNPETRSSRRLVMSAWNPCQINQMALPPCHMICQFHVRDGKYLSCALFQRSGDVGLGIPFNIASYSLLTHILAKHCGLEADEFVHFLGNCHIYEDHVMPLKIQIERNPFHFPTIEICNRHANIDDYNISDIKWINPYLSHSSLKMKMQA